MINSIILFVGLWVLDKLAEAVLDKLLQKVLSDDNLKRLSNYLKLQILLLYLDWLVQKTPLKDLPNREELGK
ncbi:MAG: hypothetical protein KME08_07805 [Aphanothece sp. CMT-3BRIN-NPC111]|jgi:hypothetical protein|nr:hypothetical protein [Aphanothece sp. CMT-3BRIN-NPC111]